MKHVYNDGGRLAAGYKGSTGDCVTRAVAIASGLPYAEVYEALARGNAEQRRTKRSSKNTGKRTARNGINVTRQWFKNYMASLGFTWTPTMHIGSGCKVHLNAKELPPGTLIVSISKHYTTVIDGVIHDTHNPSESRGVTVYPDGHTDTPKGARKLSNGNGWAYEPERCVYGYWRKAT